jgi:hypothetical protein
MRDGKRPPWANVVRDPREHPDAIIPDLNTNNVKKFTREDVGLVYGSIWKHFTKVGDDYYPQPSQWDIMNHVWRAYFVANGTDWWAPLYPPDNFKRPVTTCTERRITRSSGWRPLRFVSPATVRECLTDRAPRRWRNTLTTALAHRAANAWIATCRRSRRLSRILTFMRTRSGSSRQR